MMMLSKEMLKEFVEGASAQKVKDFSMKLVDQLNQAQLNAIEQGFKVSLSWQGGEPPEPQRFAREPANELQSMPRRGRPPKLRPEIMGEPIPDAEEETTDDLFNEIEETLGGKKTVDETQSEYDRVIGNIRKSMK